MALARGLLNRWRCRRLRAALVDCAEGALPPAAAARVRRHASACDECGEALAALEQIPAMLRESAPPVRDEAFWLRQRQAILRRVRPLEAPAARAWSPRFTWAATLAAAAAVIFFVATHRPAATPPAGSEVAAVEGLEGDDVVALADLTNAWSGEMVAPAVLDDETLAAAETPWPDAGPAGDEGDIGALDDEELERLEEIIG